ncbi:AAA domain-containing protein [Pluralibacter gergoviae]|nr:AAA family ATPase [Pluralibacter gergoviae]
MATILVDGVDKTAQIRDWTLSWSDREACVKLTCHFPSGKTFSRPLRDCQVTPAAQAEGNLLIRRGQPNAQRISSAQRVGDKYLLVNFKPDERPWIYKCEDVELRTESALKESDVFGYLRSIAQERVSQAAPGKKNIAENTLRQLDNIIAHPDTVLDAYCRGENASRAAPARLIYPFGLNESQMRAVESAFSKQISVIEGPPGTGKTQTILNIVANILLQNSSVAIVSNNNTAVENVYEKLARAGLNYAVAKLGSAENREHFFAELPARPEIAHVAAAETEDDLAQLKKHLGAQNAAARLRALIDELSIEHKYLQQWAEREKPGPLPDAGRYASGKEKIAELMARIRQMREEKLRWRNRLALLLRFGIINTAPFNSAEKRTRLFFALQLHYYNVRLQDARRELAEQEQILQANNVSELLQRVTSESMNVLHQHLAQSICADSDFTHDNYRRRFSDFIRRYPVIGSSTHSIVNSLAPNTLLDYVIIDEASQQDIIPGILALACARNIIVVGDRKQLPHVPEPTDVLPPARHYDCTTQSLLDSLFSLYGEALPVTLLKEHNRCHPKIIHFCNKQFYDNQLVVMTRDGGEEALSLVVTAKGNHARRYSNLRELESFLAVEDASGASRGFIAPYNAQISLSERVLPADFVNLTVHKFQGRECEEIVFSTVIDKKADARALDFVDDPHLINVAVSRAQKQFTLLTGDGVFSGNNKHVAALVRYMTYYASTTQVHHSPVISAFDLLYEEYDRRLESLRARLDPADSRHRSEQIAMRLIRDVLSQTAYAGVVVHQQILLRQLVTDVDNRFDTRQRELMAQGSSCDFVFYFRVGKQPFAVIEVDGGSHDAPEQQERDARKDEILAACALPLLRLRTIDSKIEEKIGAFLLKSMQSSLVTAGEV